jgi:arabinose-5-phosphate isomerase
MLIGDRIPTCAPEDRIGDILVELSNKRCGCILIVDPNHKLLGIFTDGDLRRTLQNKGSRVMDVQVHKVMNPMPSAIEPDILAWDAMKQMEENSQRRIMMLPVVDNERTLVGLIHLHDIIQSGI